MNVYQPHLLRSSLETPHVTIIIQDKDTNPKSFLVILREPENVLNFIYHYCLEACQLVLLIKSTPIVLMASQTILNSTYMLAGYENSCQTRNCYVCAHA